MSDEGKRKIAHLMKETTPKKRAPRKPRKPPEVPAASNVFSITGNGNFTAGGDMHISTGPAPRPKVNVQTGVGVIDAKQKAELTRKLKSWLAARNAVRRDVMVLGAAWAAVNAHVGVNSYHEMTPEQFKKALAWIGRERAILSSMKSAPIKIEGFRNDMIRAIKARSRELGDLNYYRPRAAATYGVSSLADMSDRQLQELRAWIMQQRRG